MKTKNIFNRLALSMLMPAMLLTTACSNEDDALNNTANTENTINKGYALPVTVNVTRGDGATRASYNESTRKLEFSAGDKLFVSGYYDGDYEYVFAGELDYVPATEKFSGTIYTSNDYSGTADALFTAATANGHVNATLLPAGYGSYGFLTIEDYDTEEKYDDFISYNNTYTLATSKADGVAQFSYEKSYNYDDGFALSPENAILNFTITGLAASTNVDVSLTSHAYDITGTVTTDAFGTATFAAGVEGDTDLNSLTLTVAGNPVTLVSSEKTLEAGHIYNITRSAAEPEVAGSYFTANSSGLKVAFSQGNLQATYNGSDWTWAFAAHQYDYIGNASGNTKVTDSYPFISENATVDLFGWVGASSSFTGVAQYGITSSKTLNSEDGYGYVADESMKAEWNSTNLTITNGGTYTWRTLTGREGGEWDWIIGQLYYAEPGNNCRASGATVNGTSNARYTHATINTDGTPVNGMILFPDGCKINSSSATSWGNINLDSEWGTKCTTAQWTHLEELGCVFLPAAGCREEAEVEEVGTDGYYWSSSYRESFMPYESNTEWAHNMYFGSGSMSPTGDTHRYRGFSVRLVREVPSN